MKDYNEQDADLVCGKTQRAVPRMPEKSTPQDQRETTLCKRLEEEMKLTADAMTDRHRMIQLLRQHPEFEAYMELQRLISRYGIIL